MSRRPIYDGRIVHLGLETAQLPNGRTVELEIIRHPGAAAVVPWHDDNTITLVHQYRHAGGGMHHEVPAGVLETGEDPQECAARELAEEAQLGGTLTRLGAIHTTPGFTDELIHLFLATDLRVVDGQPDPDECLDVVRLPVDEVLAMIRRGEITDAKTICALHLALGHRD